MGICTSICTKGDDDESYEKDRKRNKKGKKGKKDDEKFVDAPIRGQLSTIIEANRESEITRELTYESEIKYDSSVRVHEYNSSRSYTKNID